MQVKKKEMPKDTSGEYVVKGKGSFFCGYQKPLVLLYSFHDSRTRMRILTHPRYKQSKGVTISKFPCTERLSSLTFVERKKVKSLKI